MKLLELRELTHVVLAKWPGTHYFEAIAAFNCAPVAFQYRDDCEKENGKRGMEYKVAVITDGILADQAP
jgi:hypothetical protein